MGAKDFEKLCEEVILDLKDAHGNAQTDADKKHIKAAAEFIDNIQMEKTTRRSCKVGSTIP